MIPGQSDHIENPWFSTTLPPQPPQHETLVTPVADKVPEIKVSIPVTKPAALMPNVKDPVMNYRSQRNVGRGAFQAPEYNLAEVKRIADTDSYVRQAFGKKLGLMFKEGWDLVGKNPKTIKYIRTRLAQIARASKTPTNTLLRKIGANIIQQSNSFLVKVRKTEASGGRIRSIPGKNKQLKPIAAYFLVPAETVEFKLAGTRIAKWRQSMPDGEHKDYSPEDVVHLHLDRKDGFVFGTPTIVPVVDDIRALRKIEENVELLVYQHLFPLFQYKVGTENAPATVTETGEHEIDIVRREIMYMPTEGGIVTPERHEITAIGSEGRALRAESYLEHFKRRVVSGLGISLVDLGEPDTSNKSTADNMSRNLVDGVKDLQQILEDAINAEIIEELLLESTFGPDVLDEENIVRIQFKEIDVDLQIKKDAHAAQLFNEDIIDHDEARRRMGLEPWIIPSPEEVQSENDTPEAYPQWHKSRWKMYKLPELLIQALDEPWSPAARAAANDNSLPMTEQGNEESTRRGREEEIAVEKEKIRVKTQGQQKAKTPVKDGFLSQTYHQIKRDLVEQVKQTDTLDTEWTSSIIRTQMTPTVAQLQRDQLVAFRKGYSSIRSAEEISFIDSVRKARIQFSTRAEEYINKLTEDVVTALKRNVSDELENKAPVVRAVFSTLAYRTRFIEDVEIRKAKNLGIIRALSDQQNLFSATSVVTHDEACDTCKDKHGKELGSSAFALEYLPPHHASCQCLLLYNQQPEMLAQDNVTETTVVEGEADKPLPEQADDTAICPNCGKTAIRKTDTPDTYNCRACKTSFKTGVKSVTKSADSLRDNRLTNRKGKRSQYVRCKMKMAAKIREMHPDWAESQVQEMAEGACVSYLVDAELLREDATEEECVLSVKKSLRKEHPDWDAKKIKSRAYAICRSQRKGND